ncbi:MAG: tetratricopeptide repeat protein, partial [Pseudomonadota bacterium]
RLELGVAAGLAAAAVFAATAIWQELEYRRAQVAASGENTAAMGEVVSEILQNIDPLTPGAEPLEDVISSSTFEKLTTATRDQPQVQREMVISSGRALLDSGRYGAVINLVEPLVAELEAVDPKPDRYAEYLSLLGYARYRAGNPQRGQLELRRARELQRPNPSLDPGIRASTLQRLALVERRVGNVAAARELIDESIQLLAERGDRQHAQALSQRGLILTDAGDLSGALESFRTSMGMLAELPGDHIVRRAMTLSNMADTQRLAGDLAGAEANAREANSLLQDNVDNPQLLATAATTLGNVLMARESYEAAGERYQQALEAYREALGPQHPRVGLVAHNLATAQRLGGDCAAALVHYDLSIQIAQASYAEDHPELIESRRQRALCQG